MVRKLEVIVPLKHSTEIRNILVMNRSVHHLNYRECILTDEYKDGQEQMKSVSFSFMVVNKKTHELIDLLTRHGVSARFGTINVSALTSTKPRVATIKEVRRPEVDETTTSSKQSTTTKKKKRYAISDRLAYDEVYDTIDGQLHLTFDYLALIVVGALISAIGLLTNSAVSVVASMLVSPLMGPIVGMTFGAVVRDKVMLWKSFRNELIGVLVCFLAGACMGFISAPIMDEPKYTELAYGRNTQISSRGEWIALAWGAGIAAPSGVGVALGVSSDQVSALIGVAISAALLPPITNSGLCLASALVYFIDPRYPNNICQHWFKVGYISMLLFLLNWLLIFIFGIITFRMKKLHQSANDQMRMQQYNKYYGIREKIMDEEEKKFTIMVSSGDIKAVKYSLEKPLISDNFGEDEEVIPTTTTIKMKSANHTALSAEMRPRDVKRSMSSFDEIATKQ